MKTTLAVLFLGLTTSLHAATTIDFNQSTWAADSGLVTGSAQVKWAGDSATTGHIYMNAWANDDFLYFSTPTYINSFDMTARFWSGQTGVIPGKIKVEAYNSANATLWSSIIDLTAYGDWSKWLTVNVEADNVSTLKFFSPNIAETGFSTFCPSVDNLEINDRPLRQTFGAQSESVPEGGSAAALMLLGGCSLVGFSALEKRKALAKAK
jgi:hypothetical protein